ncbi:MAG: TonB-dependent receptor [Bacteroidales bacterium]|nr:TonB-dependent receptor [Bacteroidales bacterium]
MKILGMLALLFLSIAAWSQKFTVHGTIRDSKNGEALIGSTVFVKGTSNGVISNSYGFYSLTLPKGEYEIVYSYIGFQSVVKNITLNSDQMMDIRLESATEQIEAVVVTSEKKNANVTSARIGVQKMDATTIERIPVMFGEADVIKAIKLLPGVATTSESSSNISVRGGGRDQNLILLDDANVYGASHMGGMFSVFNNDAVRSVDFYKGYMPAKYGGRLSSVIDIRTNEGSTNKFQGKGSIGLLSSKVLLEVPVIKDRMGISVSGRRTYFDLLAKLYDKSSKQDVELPYYFYDLNTKVNYKLNDKHRLYLSGYFGRDELKQDIDADNKSEFGWGNYTATVRWNYIINKKLFMNLTALTSNYDYKISSDQRYGIEKKEQSFNWNAFMKDYSAKLDFGYFLNNNNTVEFGAIATYHDFNVAQVKGRMDTVKFEFRIPKYYALDYAVYLSNKQKLGSKTELEYGVRGTMFQNIGPGTEYVLNNYHIDSTIEHKKNKIYNTYYGIEPRFSASYAFNDKHSVKLGYGMTRQYLIVASNSIGGTPIDVWMPATKNIKPQTAQQVSLGYFRNFLDNKIETSVEVYYKHMDNQIEFREFSQPYLNQDIAEDFRFGIGRSYGTELYLSKPTGKLNGWISYTFSISERKTKDFWEEGWYPSPYDATHNLSIVGNYEITPRIILSANWIYATGKPFDAPAARWEQGGMILQQFNGKNGSRFPAYHRLDAGIQFKNKTSGRFKSYWDISVYNCYNRKNANSIYFTTDDNDSYRTTANRFSLFPIFPSIAYTLEF